jgi:hypothetical protein
LLIEYIKKILSYGEFIQSALFPEGREMSGRTHREREMEEGQSGIVETISEL